MTALTDAPTVYAGIEYGTRGIASRDVVARTLMDALAVVKDWPGGYELVRLVDGQWEPAFTYLSLFSGIGGLDLGLDRAGWTCVGQVERDPYCRTVLDRHWPEVPKHDDVRTAPAWWLGRGGAAVDLVAGGFPCQPSSTMGKRRAQNDARWGWPWFRDVVRAVRPRYVLVENVVGLLDTGFGDVLGDLSALGFDAEWSVLSACAFGAPHSRERVFLLAYPEGSHGPESLPLQAAVQDGRALAGAEGGGPWGRAWLPEPALDRVAHGAPRSVGLDELTALGNAVVPQVAEHVGRLILADAGRELVPA